MKTWILVANSARARLFEAQVHDGVLQELADYAHVESQLPGRAFTRGRQPRVQESANSMRHAIEPRIEPDDKAALEFAHGLADELDSGRIDHRYERLILAAPPRFLGQLRNALDEQVAKLVVRTLNKDVTRDNVADIEALLAAD